MKKIKWFFVFGIFLVTIGFAGCPIDRPVPAVFQIPDAPAGTWRASAEGSGFAHTSDDRSAWWSYDGWPGGSHEYPADRGSPITVTLTVADGFITTVTIVGPDESSGWGGTFGTVTVAVIMESWAPEQIIRRNAIEVDTVAGTTFTIAGIIQAGERALAEILRGEEGDAVRL